MNINEYILEIENLLESSPIVKSHTLNLDRKTPGIAFISGKIEFRDCSILDFKEFLEQAGMEVQKGKYGYTYRRTSDVEFRYNNAPDPRAKALSSFPHHKHLPDGKIAESYPISLAEVLQQIEDYLTGSA